ncbi:MAG: class I SAM-dependent methyltransferase [Candidatus Moraniibacteriota bacterium]|jgi:ubiquinone/menaquinone biosynthesis C-methylase UbiE
MKQEVILNILKETESGYDLVADKFSHTRKNFWGDLAFIADYIHDGDKVLDYGCGNGRLLEILKDKKIEYVGVDVSQKLIDLARVRYPKHAASIFKVTSQASLAFPADFFNRIVSVAVFHHFPKEHAGDMAKELFRITKPGGTVVVTVWNLWQKKRRKDIFNFPAFFGKIFQSGRYRGFGLGDIFIPFQGNKGEVFNRYHCMYSQKSLSNIFQSAGFEIEKCFLANEKNIILIARKK